MGTATRAILYTNRRILHAVCNVEEQTLYGGSRVSQLKVAAIMFHDQVITWKYNEKIIYNMQFSLAAPFTTELHWLTFLPNYLRVLA